MRPLEWIGKLLDRRGLDLADGRPLFQYRVTDEEFSDLLETLKLSSRFGIENARRMLSWDAAFVIYAAEWWRREYSGHWGWEDIFSSIGVDLSELPVGARNDLVESGLHRWRRKVRSNLGYRNFLGTIATEGGLPLKQLSGSDSGGWLRHVLQPVLRKHIEKGHSLPALIEAYSDLVPRSYRSAQLSEILQDIAEAVITLRDTHNLAQAERPIKLLDEKAPGWRNDFPLPVDDAAARSLLRDLVDTAAKARSDTSSAFPFECSRLLTNAEFADPGLLAQIELPTFATLQSLGLESADGLPASIDIEIYTPTGNNWPWCRAFVTEFQGRSALKLSGSSFKLHGAAATNELRIAFKFRGQRILELDIPGGEEIDARLPWLFRKVDEKWTLSGIASQSVRDKVALLYLPYHLQIRAEGDSSSLEARSPMLDGQIWRLTGNAVCEGSDERFIFMTGGEDSTAKFDLRGRRFPFSSVPHEVYIGLPKLEEYSSLTGMKSRRYSARVLAKALGSGASEWRPLTDADCGVYQLRALDGQNNILFSRTVGLLGANYAHTLQPDAHEVGRGSLILEGVLDADLTVTTPGIRSGVEPIPRGARLQLEAIPQPPKSVELSILAKGQSRPLTLVYPFPSRGGLLFDANDRLVAESKTLNLQDLYGHRIKVFNDQPHLASKFSLTLSLDDRTLSSSAARDIYVQVPLKPIDQHAELAVSDWQPLIRTLFGVARSLDATVRIELALNSRPLLSRYVRRYEHTLTRDLESGIVSIRSEDLKDVDSESLEQSTVLAINLNHPETNPETLEARQSEGIHVGSWYFDPWTRQPGPWIIYPEASSLLQFRTLLWTVGVDDHLEVGPADSLVASIGLVNESARRSAIAGALRAMADNHDHPDWQYLDALWQRTSHLPVATFDLWLTALRVPAFLAALFVKNRHDILERLEAELPIIWELVRKADWETALRVHRRKLEEHLSDEPKLVEEVLEKVIEKIGTYSPSMISTASILNGSILGVESRELALMKQPPSVFPAPQLRELYQQLFRRQSEQTWPQMLHAELTRRFKTLPEEVQSILEVHHPYQEAVVYLPFVLAWHAIHGLEGEWSESPAQIFKILQIRMFDEDWFNTAFQFLSGWLSQQGLTDSH